MNLLAIDSAGSVFSAAVSCKDEIFYTEAEAGSLQSGIAMDCIDSLMKKAGLLPEDLNGVLCMGGPGSFTGLRIGYSIAKGLALSLSIPFAPVPTLECIARCRIMNSEQKKDEVLLVAMEASKKTYFYAFFRGSERITNDCDGDAFQIANEINSYDEKIILTGPGTDLLIKSLPFKENITILDNEKRGYAKEILTIALKRKLLDDVINNNVYLNSGPEYNRLTDAELRKST